MIRVMRIFLNADMRFGHDGLALLAKKEGNINIQTLEHGEFVMFINSPQTRIKLYTANGIIAYMRSPTMKPMDLRAVAMIPKSFGASGKIDYEEDLAEMLKARLVRGYESGATA